jgi:hypothetical protein
MGLAAAIREEAAMNSSVKKRSIAIAMVAYHRALTYNAGPCALPRLLVLVLDPIAVVLAGVKHGED